MFLKLKITLLFFPSLLLSAVFLPSLTELNSTQYIEDKDMYIRTLSRNLDTLDDKDYIQIDDMRFKTNSLIESDGFSGNKWTNGIVYYQFNINVNNTNRQRWLDASLLWSDEANIIFIERTTENNYIHIKNDTGNYSYVGMVGSQQTMGIYSWTYQLIIAHEIGHALGLSHEQSRSDRDSYVSILFDNIQSGHEHNFEIRSTVSYGSYDFDSCMHYSKTSFSKNGSNTIEPLPAYSHWLDLIGQRTHLSDLDKLGMRERYPYVLPSLFNPSPSDGEFVVEFPLGQVLSMQVSDAISAVIYYDDDNNITESVSANILGGYLETTIPYVNDKLNNNGINYWYVEATNRVGKTRYPSSGSFSFKYPTKINHQKCYNKI